MVRFSLWLQAAFCSWHRPINPRIQSSSFGSSLATRPMSSLPQSSNTESDPSWVWKSPDVATTFTSIRESVPLHHAQLDMMSRLIGTFVDASEDWTWLDLGCGDGILSAHLAANFPKAQGILVDFSDPMLEASRDRMSHHEGRTQILQGDLSTPDWQSSVEKATKQQQQQQHNSNKIQVVVSSFAIHHLTNDRKQALYQEIFDLLQPGGIFLNLEHVASPTATVESVFEGAFVDSMFYGSKGQRTREECQALVHHDLTVDDDANILVDVDTQTQWLREIGFEHVDCYFKYLILALFGGVKPKKL